jgi:hypothetical protein
MAAEIITCNDGDEDINDAVTGVITDLESLKTLIQGAMEIGETGESANLLMNMGNDWCLDAAVEWLEVETPPDSSDVSKAVMRLYEYQAMLLGARAIAENSAHKVLLAHALEALEKIIDKLTELPPKTTKVAQEVAHG